MVLNSTTLLCCPSCYHKHKSELGHNLKVHNYRPHHPVLEGTHRRSNTAHCLHHAISALVKQGHGARNVDHSLLVRSQLLHLHLLQADVDGNEGVPSHPTPAKHWVTTNPSRLTCQPASLWASTSSASLQMVWVNPGVQKLRGQATQ